MATLTAIKADINAILRDRSYEAVLTASVNNAVQRIAAGIRMPDGSTTPPLPDLFTSETIATSTTLPNVSLPATYQRNVFYISDANDDKIYAVRGGNYYSFGLFLDTAIKKDLSLEGDVTMCCVKGSSLYYQGIPTTSVDLTVRFYRKPIDMIAGTDEVDGLPDHLQSSLIKHFVCKELFGEGIEDGEDNQGKGTQYHTEKFIEAMTDLVDFIGLDTSPAYYKVGH